MRPGAEGREEEEEHGKGRTKRKPLHQLQQAPKTQFQAASSLLTPVCSLVLSLRHQPACHSVCSSCSALLPPLWTLALLFPLLSVPSPQMFTYNVFHFILAFTQNSSERPSLTSLTLPCMGSVFIGCARLLTGIITHRRVDSWSPLLGWKPHRVRFFMCFNY